MSPSPHHGGPISWMARNPVAANLMMIILLAGGFLISRGIKQEVFPEFDLDVITIVVPYPGASPAELETGALLAIEQAVRGLDGVKKVTGVALEGAGTVSIELLLGTDGNKALADVKGAVDRITTLPRDAERPIVSLMVMKRDVISLVLYGDLSEHDLRELLERARDDLLRHPRITQVELEGVRRPEIAIEVPQESLRRYGLTLAQVAQTVAAASVEVPGGAVKTPGGEVLLRVAERRDRGAQFADVPLLSLGDGGVVRLGDVADVVDGFEDTDERATFNGKPAAMLRVYRVGDQTPLDIAEAVKAYAVDLQERLPPGVFTATWDDRSEIYRDRIDLLMRNAYLGLSLVMLLLSLLLEIRLAFWVALGIPISFLGSFLFLPGLAVSINMISLFAFIVTLGLVVDDAIVVGENVYEYRQRGMSPVAAAIAGARNVAMPVVFSVLTTMAAFAPLLFVPGVPGKFFRTIPVIVISVLMISLVESLWILPAHLAHMKEHPGGLLGAVHRVQQRFSRLFEWLIERTYAPVLRATATHRYLTMAAALAVLIATFGYMRSGRLEFTFMTKVESDRINASAVLPFGTPIAQTRQVRQELERAARRVLARHGGDAILRGFYSLEGSGLPAGGIGGGGSMAGSHLTVVRLLLVPLDERSITAGEFAKEWREEVGEIPGIEALTFEYNIGPAAGRPVDVELKHPDREVLERAATEIAQTLRRFTGVTDVDDGFSGGKPQLAFRTTPVARSLGLTEAEIARQLRHAFYGAEALRQPRGIDELRVLARLPQTERRSLANVEDLVLRTPQGGEVPLRVAAEVETGRSYTQIRRVDGRRVLNVTADVVPGVANANKVLADLERDTIPGLMARTPGLSYTFEGESTSQRESFQSLGKGFAFALLVIFALIAIPFKSYIQPLVVMSAIPFGIVGAVLGHVLMGYDMSIVSVMGIIALSGVVVNDSIVMIVAANERRTAGDDACTAITRAGTRRFRPIVLTSLTTFLGLAPMIFETSTQARFLIPMALSLGYGILFGTFVIQLLVPSLYLIVEDVTRLLGVKIRSYHTEEEAAETPIADERADAGAPLA